MPNSATYIVALPLLVPTICGFKVKGLSTLLMLSSAALVKIICGSVSGTLLADVYVIVSAVDVLKLSIKFFMLVLTASLIVLSAFIVAFVGVVNSSPFVNPTVIFDVSIIL